MLRRKIKLNNIDKNEEINLDNFFISSDLSYISGTVVSAYSISLNDTIWVDTVYSNVPKSVKITSLDTVKRNGYILYNKVLPIQTTTYIDSTSTINLSYTIKYVEYNGNTYIQNMNNQAYLQFFIEGKTYISDPNDITLTIQAKAYVEDDKVEVNGITYNVICDQGAAYATFSDSEGNPVVSTSDWDISNITKEYKYVQKIELGNAADYTIGTTNITHFGYQPYIIYNDEKYDLEEYYDSGNSRYIFGVKINDTLYPFDFGFGELNSSEYEETYRDARFYDRDYYSPEDYGNYITIDDIPYYLSFEPIEGLNGSNLCIETETENLSILIGDILKISSANNISTLNIMTDKYGVDYVFYNNQRYNRYPNLCDIVTIGGSEYQLEYNGDSATPYVGMLATCTLDTGEIVHFIVNEINNSVVKSVYKAHQNESGGWVKSMTLKASGDSTVYTDSTSYSVTSRDGFIIVGTKCPVETIEKYTNNGDDISFEVINFNHPIEYKFQVIDTLGSNKIICEPFLNESVYSQEDASEIRSEVLGQVTSNDCIVSKKPNTFGTIDLSLENWIADSLAYTTATNIFELSQIQNKIVIYRLRRFFSLPLNLVKCVNNDICREDLIMSTYYDEIAEEYVNDIVDMDKDIYTPVSGSTATMGIDKIQFNLHFRTRDMDTWTIYRDEGEQTYLDANNNEITVHTDVNYQYCNWFCTDYWPYNQLATDKDINNCMQMSDLLGFLYFTTDDVKRKANKLSKSFLRLTYFDSVDPSKQNMLGTSTIYFDCDKYFDILYQDIHSGTCYSDVIKSVVNHTIEKDTTIPAGVLREEFNVSDSSLTGSGPTKRLDSRIEVTNRYMTDASSEGFYAYILKHYADKKRTQTIYMKAEFFHAGIGVKIPMVIATDGDCNAIDFWTKEKINTWKNGCPLHEVYKRLYIPIDIYYSKDLKKFVYSVSTKNNFNGAIYQKNSNNLVFNLFELKVKN